MSAMPLGPPAPSGIGARRALALGLTVGSAVTLHECIDLYAAQLDAWSALVVAARILSDCSLQFVALSFLLAWRSRRGLLTWREAGLCWLAFAAAASIEVFLHYEWSPLGGTWASVDRWARAAWIALFYGGMFIVAWTMQQQTRDTSRLLADAEVARQRTEGLLERAQMRALQGRIDPALLLRAMCEVRRRHAIDAPGSARLLDALVAFLRAAMPAVRSGDSSLAAELRVARRYAALGGELDVHRPRWSFSIDAALPALRFPALWLMPVMDRLESAQAWAAAPLQCAVSVEAGRLVLHLHGGVTPAPRWIEPELVHRLKVGLRAAFGDAWTLAVEPLPAGLTLTLDPALAEAALQPASADSIFDNLEERR